MGEEHPREKKHVVLRGRHFLGGGGGVWNSKVSMAGT